MQSFTYTALQEPENIRLLKLSQTETGQLECELHEIELSDEYNPQEAPTKYAALSYTWGDTSNTVTLICDGKDMQITHNLAEALHMTLRANPHGFLWVDQICINQHDNEEKAGQVRRMTLIYNRAITILAWIGPERDDTGLAVEWINKVAVHTSGFGNDVFRDHTNDEGRRRVETVEEISLAQSEELGIPFANEAAWGAFSSFYDQPWFQRLWVVQEVLPAREASVICGTHSIDWHLVKAAAAWYTYKAGLIHSKYDATRQVDGIAHCRAMNIPWTVRMGSEFMAELMGQTVRPIYQWSFADLLTTFRNRLAGDPRDKVFALLGISTLHDSDSDKGKSSLLQPDYDKPVMEVYRDATRGLIERDSPFHNALGILKHAVPASAEPGWPSWVPDWRITDISEVGHPLPPDGSIPYQNTHHYLPPTIGMDNELHVEGFTLGTVVHQSEYHHIGELLRDLRGQREECRQVYQDRFLTDIYIPTSESVDTAWAMSLQGGQLQDGFATKETQPSKFGEILVDMIETMSLPRDTPEQQKARQEQIRPYMDKYGLNQDWLEYCRLRYCERRWFITDKGYIGLGNWRMEVGDVVAVLWGLDIACILRPVRDKTDTYQFGGEAYCHGIKEAIEELEKDDDSKPKGVNMVLV